MIIRYYKDTDYDDVKTNLIEGDIYIYYHVTDTKEKLLLALGVHENFYRDLKKHRNI